MTRNRHSFCRRFSLRNRCGNCTEMGSGRSASKIGGILECRLSMLIPKTKKELLSYVSKKYANLANPGMNKHVRISRVFHRSNIWADIGTCRMGRRYSV